MQFSIYYFVIAKKGKGGRKKNNPEIIPPLEFGLPSNKPTCLAQKKEASGSSAKSQALQAEMCCVHQPKEKEKGDSASWFAGTAPPVALPAPIKAAAGAPSATWAPAVCYFKGKAIK